MDRHCSTVPAGEEFFFSEGNCFWAAIVCRVQVEQVLGGGAIVSSLLRREEWREGGEGGRREEWREKEGRGGGRRTWGRKVFRKRGVCVWGGGRVGE